jgi:hypothetical protein
MDIYEGVNQLLGVIGEIPITDNTQALEAEAISDVGIARDTLLRLSKSVQQEGYWFNTEVNYPLVPNTEGFIPIGDNILSIYSPKHVIKDHKLYDIEKHTYLFDKVQKLDVVFYVPFDDLPYVVADVIVREGCVSFYNNVLGDTQEIRVLENNLGKAQVALQKAHFKHKKLNLITGNKLLNRSQNPSPLV